MKPIVLRLDPDLRSKLELLAKSTGRSSSLLVAEAVDIFVTTELDRLRREAEGTQEHMTYKPWKTKA